MTRRLAPVAVLVAALMPVVLRAQSEPIASGFDAVVKQAVEAREAGRFDEAIAGYRKALELKPSWTEGRWDLAMLLYHVDNYGDARDLFATIVEADPARSLPRALKGLCEFKLGNHDAALDDLQHARRQRVDDAQVRPVADFHLALLLNRAGNPDAAFEILAGFVQDEKEAPVVIAALGLAVLRMPILPDDIPPDKREMVLLAGRGGYHMARVRRSAIGRLAFDELATRYPVAPNVHYAFGSYLLAEEPEAAIEEFRKELRLTPDHYPAMLQMALAETRRGNPEAAIPLAERAVELAPDAPAGRLMLGRALLAAGQTERAIQQLERGVQLAPENPGFYFSLGTAYQRAGRDEEAARARAEFQRLQQETGDRRQETGDRRQETGDRRQEQRSYGATELR